MFPTIETDKAVARFIRDHGEACGGNWAAMAMSAIRNGLPDVYRELPEDQSFDLIELYNIIANSIENH